MRNGDVDLVRPSGTAWTRGEEASGCCTNRSNCEALDLTLGPRVTSGSTILRSDGFSTGVVLDPSNISSIGSSRPPFFLGVDRSGVVIAVELAGYRFEEA